MRKWIYYFLYASRVVRSIYNGMLGSTIISIFLYCVDYQGPNMISLTIFASTLSAVLKTKLITLVNQRVGQFEGLILTYFFYLPPLIAINYCNLIKAKERIAFVIILTAGFFPADGEEIILFEQVEKELVLKHSCKGENPLRLYKLLGYSFQALGGLAALSYMAFQMEKVNYIEEVRVRHILLLIYFLGIANIVLYTVFRLGHNIPTIPVIANNKKYHPYLDASCWKLKILTLVNGFTLGLLIAPSIFNFLDLKLNLYHDKISLMIFAFYFLKGVGEEMMERMQFLKPILKYLGSVSNICLVLVALLPEGNSSLICLLLAFPFWNYGRVALRSQFATLGCSSEQTGQFEKEAVDWERMGAVIGVFTTSFSFSIVYFQPSFAYPFVLCGIFRQLNQTLISFSLFKRAANQRQVITSEILPLAKEIEIQYMSIQSTDNTNVRSQKKRNLSSRIRKIIVALISALVLGFSIFVYSSSCYWIDSCVLMQTRSEKVPINPSLKLFNSSLPHFLAKEGISSLKVIDCDPACLQELKNHQGYSALLANSSVDPEWLHFPSMAYFSSSDQARKALSVVDQNPSVKGYSLIWTNPLLYNKMPYQMYSLFAAVAEDRGFHFAEMPSLNLRGIENQIVMIFTRSKRKPVDLPAFVKRQPHKGYLAITLVFKMVTNYQYIREFILYHLNQGVDKFFLYDNDRDIHDPHYSKENRDIGTFLVKCHSASTNQYYAVFQSVWEQFYDHIIYVPMRIGDNRSQRQTYLHYALYYKFDTLFTICTDLDEYVMSPSGKYLPDVLGEMLRKDHVTTVKLLSRDFKSRVCANKQVAIEQYSWLHSVAERRTVKCIIMSRMMVEYNIHARSSRNGGHAYIRDDRHDFRINHYKITSTYQEFTPIVRYGIDESMKPFIEGMKVACHGKCSDAFGLTCNQTVYAEMMHRYCR